MFCFLWSSLEFLVWDVTIGNGHDTSGVFWGMLGLKNLSNDWLGFWLDLGQVAAFRQSHSIRHALEPLWMSRFLCPPIPTWMSMLQAGHCSVLCSVNSESPAFLIYPLACPVIPLSGINKYLFFGMPYSLNFRLGVAESNGQKITLLCYRPSTGSFKQCQTASEK